VESLLRLVVVVLFGYAALCAAVYLLQDRLIFLPRPLTLQPDGPHVQPASVQRGDVTLRGWIVNADSPGPLLIYFGGNAEELSNVVNVFARLEAATVLINYRGFGESEGAPSAAALIADARAVVEVMDQRWGDGRPLILFGRSIGSGIAVEATRAARVDALILMSPYRTLTALAKRHVPYLPVDWLLRHHIDATAALALLPPEILVLYGRRDHIIPTEESRAFLRLLNPPGQLVEFDAGHNVPLLHPDLWLPIEKFVARHAGS
jgi:hypothetical protein